MKKLALLLLVLVILLSHQSCTKHIDIIHNVHDTLYIDGPAKIDTITRFVIRVDTVIRHDDHVDTVIQVKHDTLIIKSVRTDTLIQFLPDTIYLTKTLHDTVTRIQWLTDTINNYITVIKHDTVLRVDSVVTIDTVYSSNFQNSYPVPATDNGLIFIAYDTIGGTFWLDSITITNLASWDNHNKVYTQHNAYIPKWDSNFKTYVIRGPFSMIANLQFHYHWDVVASPQIMLSTFDHYHSWTAQTPNPQGGAPGTIRQIDWGFNFIDLGQVFTIYIKNRYS
ncbi:MAG: hypothetical protein M3N30_12935 [Bacteroidota bacterium]|nr:hypothetical protein [Bacteroidota bacterium]